MTRSIGRYEIREELGRGGMAAVYLAFDPKLDREVALKLMDQRLSADPTFTSRFEREAKTVASLEHGAIVSLHDFGEAGGWLYLVMRYMEGGTLKELITRGPLAVERAYNVVRRIGSALDKAHDRGIIHRDLKPANILLDEEREPYLSDFGIVKVASGDTEYLTETGQTIGTYAYMSPEQVMGEELSSRSDIYALGLVLYEMLAGRHPYGEASTSGAMAVAQTHQPVPDVTKSNPALPAGCQAIIEKALAKDPGDRYASGREMAMTMFAALSGEPVIKKPTSGAAEVVATAPVAQRSSPPTQVTSQVTASPLPHWIIVLEGLFTAGTGIIILWRALYGPSEDPQLIKGLGLYWLFTGLLTFGGRLSRPAGWQWRTVVGIMGIIVGLGIIILPVSQAIHLVLGAVGAIAGLIQVVQAFRGAGLATGALGAASVILGLAHVVFALTNTYDSWMYITAVGLAVCGIVATVLTFRENQAATSA